MRLKTSLVCWESFTLSVVWMIKFRVSKGVWTILVLQYIIHVHIRASKFLSILVHLQMSIHFLYFLMSVSSTLTFLFSTIVPATAEFIVCRVPHLSTITFPLLATRPLRKQDCTATVIKHSSILDISVTHWDPLPDVSQMKVEDQ